MKQQDIAVIIVVAVFSGVISYFLSGVLFSSDENTSQTVSRVTEVQPEFELPDNKYFNNNAINPTQLIQIGDNNNENPFTNGQ